MGGPSEVFRRERAGFPGVDVPPLFPFDKEPVETLPLLTGGGGRLIPLKLGKEPVDLASELEIAIALFFCSEVGAVFSAFVAGSCGASTTVDLLDFFSSVTLCVC